MTIKAKELRRKRTSCAYPSCKGNAEARGLCGIHYQQALRVVRSGRRSWDQLQERGLAKPRRPKNRFLED